MVKQSCVYDDDNDNNNNNDDDKEANDAAQV
jgi:hypothetical protein